MRFEQGIPSASFGFVDVHAEFERLNVLGVPFTMEPTHYQDAMLVILDDSCGNLIQIVQT